MSLSLILGKLQNNGVTGTSLGRREISINVFPVLASATIAIAQYTIGSDRGPVLQSGQSIRFWHISGISRHLRKSMVIANRKRSSLVRHVCL